MRVPDLGKATALTARETDLAGEIARVTSLSPQTVVRRLNAAHGKTLVRTVFENEWPNNLEGIGRTLVRDALESRSFLAQIADILSLSSRAVRQRLESASGRSMVRTVFADEWFDPKAVAPNAVGDTAVAVARDIGLGERIAKITGLAERTVARRLANTNGHTLVRNAFEPWPDDETPPLPEPQQRRAPKPSPRTKTTDKRLIAGRYELLERLGSGGFGEVWRARDRVAPGEPERVLKFPYDNADALESLEDEYRKASDLKHGNICKIHTWDKDRERGAFLVLQYGGRSLARVLNEIKQPLPLAIAVHFTNAIAAALDYAHSVGVIHVDVSPGNILEGTDERPLLTDFGAAKRVTTALTTGGRETLGVTSTASAFHRVYVAPEVMLGGSPRFASDQYSLALVACSILEGRVHLSRSTSPLSKLSATQNDALERALMSEPRDRFPSCGAFVAALSS